MVGSFMQVVTKEIVSGKKVLLRYDIDVALKETEGGWEIGEEFKLKAGLDTLKLCIQNASKIIIVGHLGRPFKTAEDEKGGNPQELSAKPIHAWLQKTLGQEIFFAQNLEDAANSSSKIVLLENIRFFHGEVPGPEYHASCTSKTCDVDFAKQLASLGEVYVNEAFSSHNKAASTTIVPTLLPHFAGLHFIKEVEILLNVRNNPKKPFIAIMGGAKVDTKLPVISILAQKADAVLVGGKLIHEIRDQEVQLPKNVMVGKLNEDGFDIALETSSVWSEMILKSAMIVWNGPVGMFEDLRYNQTQKIIEAMLGSSAEVVIGGGDSVAALSQYGLLEKAEQKTFVSVGGGAMLKLIADGTLPTIEALT
jgi:3-phosphoglycerate kinase